MDSSVKSNKRYKSSQTVHLEARYSKIEGDASRASLGHQSSLPINPLHKDELGATNHPVHLSAIKGMTDVTVVNSKYTLSVQTEVS